MELGSGIAVASAILGIVAIIFRLFQEGTTITTNKTTSVSTDHCPDHSGICTNIDTLTAWLNKIESKLDKVIERKS
ncbi:MAG: hypothetical protein ACLQBQ_09565 [Smithella sp.]